jgi:hypothetical protein
VQVTASPASHTTSQRYAKVIETSKRARWEIDRGLIRGCRFDYRPSFLLSGLSLVGELPFRSAAAPAQAETPLPMVA